MSIRNYPLLFFATVRANSYPIEVVKEYSDDANYYGVVLIE
jgi:hypothetical protein